MNLSRAEFEEAMQEFRSTLTEHEDEYYTSEQELFGDFLEKMLIFFYKDEILKEYRYKQYLQLKAEFEG